MKWRKAMSAFIEGRKGNRIEVKEEDEEQTSNPRIATMLPAAIDSTGYTLGPLQYDESRINK